jgi:hypothetical protein
MRSPVRRAAWELGDQLDMAVERLFWAFLAQRAGAWGAVRPGDRQLIIDQLMETL